MLKQVIGCLKPARGESYLDVTAGMGGHGAAVIAATAAPQKATLVDRDPQVAQVLGDKFPAAQVLNQDFLSASRKLLNDGKKFDMILADLGASSLHFEDADRGFSFRKSGPLDMRMDTHQELTAWQIVNNWSQKDLATIFRKYGEEPRADLVAKAIVSARPINDTLQLAAIISRAVPKRGKIHPATKLFQAIRIAVNDELGQLEQSLPIWLKLLKNNGRLAVISFHSLEDRIAKQFFAEHAKSSFDAELKLLTKKPITARHEEIVSNPRARSAKLRAAGKIKTKK